jgi:hypothetical protein
MNKKRQMGLLLQRTLSALRSIGFDGDLTRDEDDLRRLQDELKGKPQWIFVIWEQ